MVRDTLIRGLEDPEIRQDILGHENQDMALELVLKLVEAKESGKRSEASLLGADKAHGSSDYKKGKKYPKGAKRSTCTNCGEPSHEGGNSLETERSIAKHLVANAITVEKLITLPKYASPANGKEVVTTRMTEKKQGWSSICFVLSIIRTSR